MRVTVSRSRENVGLVGGAARRAPVFVVRGEDEVAAGCPGVGTVAQSGAGERVEVLGEARVFAQGAEPVADVVGQVGEAAAAQPVLDENAWPGPRWGRASSRRPGSGGRWSVRWPGRMASGAGRFAAPGLAGCAQAARRRAGSASGRCRLALVQVRSAAAERATEFLSGPQLQEGGSHPGRPRSSTTRLRRCSPRLAWPRSASSRSWSTRNAARSADSTTRSGSNVVALSQPLSLPCW